MFQTTKTFSNGYKPIEEVDLPNSGNSCLLFCNRKFIFIMFLWRYRRALLNIYTIITDAFAWKSEGMFRTSGGFALWQNRDKQADFWPIILAFSIHFLTLSTLVFEDFGKKNSFLMRSYLCVYCLWVFGRWSLLACSFNLLLSFSGT